MTPIEKLTIILCLFLIVAVAAVWQNYIKTGVIDKEAARRAAKAKKQFWQAAVATLIKLFKKAT